MSLKFRQFITKNMTITRATNVGTKFILFINTMYKEFLKYSTLQGNTCKVLRCLWKFLTEGSNFEYVMIVLLKEINRAKTIVSSIFFVGGTEVPILDAIYHKRSP